MKSFDVLIIGGGAAGMSCALVLGSAKSKPFAIDKKIGIVMHQKSSALTSGKFYNALGVPSGITGKELLENGKTQITNSYPHIEQIENERVVKISKENNHFIVSTNKNSYQTKQFVVAISPSKNFKIEGLMNYVEPHQKIPEAKERIQLKNTNYLIEDGIYVAGVLAGLRSQFAIAAGSGAQVATDILTLWNNGNHTMIHDTIFD